MLDSQKLEGEESRMVDEGREHVVGIIPKLFIFSYISKMGASTPPHHISHFFDNHHNFRVHLVGS